LGVLCRVAACIVCLGWVPGAIGSGSSPAVPPAPEAGSVPVPIVLNQDYMRAAWADPGAFPAPVVPPRAVQAMRPSFDDPASMLEAVLIAAGAAAVVYPSEGYFYYRLPLGHRIVSGNLRFVDIEHGVLHIGYFDELNPVDMRTASFRAPDLAVVPVSEQEFEVSFRDRRVVFAIDRSAFEASTIRLAPGEEIVSGILDESGFYLHLLYCPEERAFYYVLNGDRPMPDVLDPVPMDPRVLVGRRSRFLFFRDEAWGRLVLIGVRSESVRTNDYFDGPFDQVPPRLPLKERLEAAYPYVKYRGGIDDHGVFKELEGQRVAISPYVQYDTIEQALHLLARPLGDERLNGPPLWAALTDEPKRHFDPAREAGQTLGQQLAALRQQVQGPGTPIYVRQGWPPNHLAVTSLKWPSDHQAETSRLWPPNHEAVTSGGSEAQER